MDWNLINALIDIAMTGNCSATKRQMAEWASLEMDLIVQHHDGHWGLRPKGRKFLALAQRKLNQACLKEMTKTY